MQTIALIVAGGSSTRFGMSKLYQDIDGIPLILKTIKAFTEHPLIDGVIVVINKDHISQYKSIIHNQSVKILPLAYGGDTRSKSVLNGIQALANASLQPQKLLIHDAARPFVDQRLITNVIEELDQYEAVDVVMPAVDTVKYIKDSQYTAVSRDHLYTTQTPQGFHFELIKNLHYSNNDNHTDDISLCMKGGITVGTVIGNIKNYKVTFAEDI